MNNEQLAERIGEALELELAKIYDELGISTGDISPMDFLEWEKRVTEVTETFLKLIAYNTTNKN